MNRFLSLIALACTAGCIIESEGFLAQARPDAPGAPTNAPECPATSGDARRSCWPSGPDPCSSRGVECVYPAAGARGPDGGRPDEVAHCVEDGLDAGLGHWRCTETNSP